MVVCIVGVQCGGGTAEGLEVTPSVTLSVGSGLLRCSGLTWALGVHVEQGHDGEADGGREQAGAGYKSPHEKRTTSVRVGHLGAREWVSLEIKEADSMKWRLGDQPET